MNKLIQFLTIIILLLGCKEKENNANTVKNGLLLESRKYSTIIVNNKEWTSENYDGLAGIYYNNEIDARYGKLISRYDLKIIEKLLSDGWRIPTIRDYVDLIENFGGFKDPTASKLSNKDIIDKELNVTTIEKLISKTDWHYSGNNESGFNILPAGMFTVSDSTFREKGNRTFLWTSDIVEGLSPYYLPMALGIASYGGEIGATFAEYPEALTHLSDNSFFGGSLRFVRDINIDVN